MSMSMYVSVCMCMYSTVPQVPSTSRCLTALDANGTSDFVRLLLRLLLSNAHHACPRALAGPLSLMALFGCSGRHGSTWLCSSHGMESPRALPACHLQSRGYNQGLPSRGYHQGGSAKAVMMLASRVAGCVLSVFSEVPWAQCHCCCFPWQSHDCAGNLLIAPAISRLRRQSLNCACDACISWRGCRHHA